MKFLADANISVEIVTFIRSNGHDCTDSRGLPAQASDIEVLRMAESESRIVITADKDFGELVFVHKAKVAGVILLRLSEPAESDRVARFAHRFDQIVKLMPGSFVTLTSTQLRSRPIDLG